METVIPVPVPASADLRKMLFELVDKMVTCTESTVAPEAGGGNIAIYQGRDGAPLALLVADLTFSASSASTVAASMPAWRSVRITIMRIALLSSTMRTFIT